jgi:hypothetical protein
VTGSCCHGIEPSVSVISRVYHYFWETSIPSRRNLLYGVSWFLQFSNYNARPRLTKACRGACSKLLDHRFVWSIDQGCRVTDSENNCSPLSLFRKKKLLTQKGHSLLSWWRIALLYQNPTASPPPAGITAPTPMQSCVALRQHFTAAALSDRAAHVHSERPSTARRN